jgi:hypothetical protein
MVSAIFLGIFLGIITFFYVMGLITLYEFGEL